MTLLGIDVGTSAIKVVLTDESGNKLADTAVSYHTTTAGVGAEQDANEWWGSLIVALGVVLDARSVPGELSAVAVTSQAPTLVPVDADGNPTSPALTWLDRRATDQARRIGLVVPQSRNGADPFFGTAKLPWLAEHRPEALHRASHVLSANGFIVRRLSGVATLDDTTASLMQGFDETTRSFDADLLSAESSLRYLPPIVSSAAVAGVVTRAAAQATGLPAGLPVVAGGIDAIGSALEAGATKVGDPLVDMTGFSSVTMLTVARGTHVPGFIHSRHCVPDVDLLITAQVTAGATVDWVNNLDSARDLRDDEALLGRERPGRVMMVPSLAGERTPTWNTAARGVIDGIDLATDGIDLMLAAMEGNALALARDISVLRAAGYGVNRVLSTGGGAASTAWLTIKADVLGVPVDRPASGHGAAQGAAALAGLAVGVYDSPAAACATAGAIQASYQPDPRRTRAYAAALERYEAMSQLNAGRGE